MSFFDRFKKKQDEISSTNLDLSNPIIKRVVLWIEDPREFGKSPDEIKILDERLLFWPTGQNEKCFLVEFNVDGKYYIAFAGPIIWCFIGIDFKKLSCEQLYERYAGWYIAFHTLNSKDYDKASEGRNEAVVLSKLKSSGLASIETSQKIFIGGKTYYEFMTQSDGIKSRVVGVEDDLKKYPIDYVLPFYEYIGIGWDPLNV